MTDRKNLTAAIFLLAALRCRCWTQKQIDRCDDCAAFVPNVMRVWRKSS